MQIEPTSGSLAPFQELSKPELADLKNKSLRLDCTMITLDNADGSKTLQGPGIIEQRDVQGFDVTVFLAAPINWPDDLPPAFRNDAVLPGMVIPDSHFWSMTAIDTSNRVWKAERIYHPSHGGHVNSTTGHTVGCDCRELIYAGNARSSAPYVGLMMRAYDKWVFPRNHHTTVITTIGDEIVLQEGHQNVAKFNVRGWAFLLYEIDGEIILRATSNTDRFHKFFASRVTEALLYCLGKRIHWSVIERSHDGLHEVRLLSHEERIERKNHTAPIAISTINEPQAVWHLFELYLDFILKDEDSPFHPLSQHVLAVVRSHESSIEGHALTVAVAVESLLSKFFPGTSNDPNFNLSVNSLLDHVNKWDGDNGIKERATSAIGLLKSVRPGDKLRSLVQKNAVTESYIKAWTNLRNKAAHGDWDSVADFQPILDQSAQVFVLFNQLIFHLIGYKGNYTDWGARARPPAVYPLVQAPITYK